MQKHAEHASENKNQAVTHQLANKRGKQPSYTLVDNRPAAVLQRKWQEMAENSFVEKQKTPLRTVITPELYQQNISTNESTPSITPVIQKAGIRVGTMNDVEIRKTPAADGEIIDDLLLETGDIVKYINKDPSGDWTEIQFADGTKGWVPSNSLVEQPDPGDSIDDLAYAEVNAPLYHNNDPKLADVKQGSLSDCYLIASMAAVATTVRGKQIIRDAIVTNVNGTYTVKLSGFSEEGEIEAGDDIIIDKWLPVIAEEGETPKLIFALKNTPIDQVAALWPAIIEKAWAADSEHKQYVEIEDDNAATAMSILTGIRSEALQWNPELNNFCEEEAFTWFDAYNNSIGESDEEGSGGEASGSESDDDKVDFNVADDVLINTLRNAFALGDQAFLAESLADDDDTKLLNEEHHIFAGHVYVITAVSTINPEITLWNPTGNQPPGPLPIGIFKSCFDGIVKSDLRPQAQ